MAPGRKLIVRSGDAVVGVTVAGDGNVQVDESAGPLTVAASGHGVYRVSDGTRTATVHVAEGSGRRWVFVEGDVFELEVARRGTARGAARGHADALAAPMPATVTRIAAAPGTAVRRGDVVLVLEAMKMELPIRALKDGTVTKLHCEAGQLVDPGVPLVEID